MYIQVILGEEDLQEALCNYLAEKLQTKISPNEIIIEQIETNTTELKIKLELHLIRTNTKDV